MRDVREIVRDEPLMRDRILEAGADGALTVPGLAAADGAPAVRIVPEHPYAIGGAWDGELIPAPSKSAPATRFTRARSSARLCSSPADAAAPTATPASAFPRKSLRVSMICPPVVTRHLTAVAPCCQRPGRDGAACSHLIPLWGWSVGVRSAEGLAARLLGPRSLATPRATVYIPPSSAEGP